MCDLFVTDAVGGEEGFAQPVHRHARRHLAATTPANAVGDDAEARRLIVVEAILIVFSTTPQSVAPNIRTCTVSSISLKSYRREASPFNSAAARGSATFAA